MLSALICCLVVACVVGSLFYFGFIRGTDVSVIYMHLSPVNAPTLGVKLTTVCVGGYNDRKKRFKLKGSGWSEERPKGVGGWS